MPDSRRNSQTRTSLTPFQTNKHENVPISEPVHTHSHVTACADVEDGEVMQPHPDVTMTIDDDEREEGELSDDCALVDSATLTRIRVPHLSAVIIPAASSLPQPSFIQQTQTRPGEQDDSEPQRKRKARRGKGAEMARRSKHREARRIRRRAQAVEKAAQRAATAGEEAVRESEVELEATLSMASVPARATDDMNTPSVD
ncbi:hypothetical protein DENSPDRAFT_847012 [Dentipellis sp. KUC8613]|nr:hypothetical protein DENSPDRAFT_847012 [Dentipellis sp. KUC8613]